MSNDNVWEKLLRQQTSINKMLVDGKRDPEEVSNVFQKIIDEKFRLVKDLGMIIVPKEYQHKTRLGHFWMQNNKKFCNYNELITDENFGEATRLIPGQKFGVKIFEQTFSGHTKSEERIEFLRSRKHSVPTGAHGASLVFEQKGEELPKGYWYLSFDEMGKLGKICGDYGVPAIRASSDGGFGFDLHAFKSDWSCNDRFFEFFRVG